MWKRYLMVLIAVVATMLATNQAAALDDLRADVMYGLTPEALAPRFGQLVAVQETQGPFLDNQYLYALSYRADATSARLYINFSLRETWEEGGEEVTWDYVRLDDITIRHGPNAFGNPSCSQSLSEGTMVVYCTINLTNPATLQNELCGNDDGGPPAYNIRIRANATLRDNDGYPFGDFSRSEEATGGPYVSPNIDITRANPTFSSQDICMIDYNLDDSGGLVDTDGDTIPDVSDTDDDNDSIPDDVDPCPLVTGICDDEVAVESPPSADPGVADPDGDSDGISDSADSCPDAVDQGVDADEDGIDAACDDNDTSQALTGGRPGVEIIGPPPVCTGTDCGFGIDDTSTGVNLQRGGGGSCSVAPGASGDTLSFLLAVLGLLPLGLGRRFR